VPVIRLSKMMEEAPASQGEMCIWITLIRCVARKTPGCGFCPCRKLVGFASAHLAAHGSMVHGFVPHSVITHRAITPAVQGRTGTGLIAAEVGFSLVPRKGPSSRPGWVDNKALPGRQRCGVSPCAVLRSNLLAWRHANSPSTCKRRAK
jgi:hypothetical protein